MEASHVYRVRALEVAERMGDPAMLTIVLLSLGSILFIRGDWAGVRAQYRRAEDVIGSLPPSWFRAYLPFFLGQLLLAEGDESSATRYLEDCLAIAEQTHDLQALRLAHGLLALRDLLQDRGKASGAAALSRLSPLLDGASTTDETAELLPLVAWAHLQMGDAATGRNVVARALTLAVGQGNRFYQLDALRLQGMVAARQACWDEAERALQEGCALARGMPYPQAEARLRYELGRAQVLRSDTATARAHFEAALAIFTRLGAGGDVRRTERQLGDLHLSAASR